jgi:hypothetical protein
MIGVITFPTRILIDVADGWRTVEFGRRRACQFKILSTGMTYTISGRSGMYFDLNAKTNVVLQSFDVQGNASSWDVYYKTGTYAGSELNQSAGPS